MLLANPLASDPRHRHLCLTHPRARKGDREALRDGSLWECVGPQAWADVTPPEYDFPLPSREVSDRAIALGKLAVAQDAQMPTLSAIKQDMPELPITEHPDGTWEANAPVEPERRARLDDMFSGVRKLEVEKSDIVNSARENVTLVDSQGRMSTAPVERAELVAKRKGLTEKRRYGRRKRNV